MKKLTLILALSSISVAAMAQTAKTSGFTLRAGYSYLADKTARDATSNSGFLVGIGYDLQNMKGMNYGSNAKVSIDVDYDYHSGNGAKISNWSGQLVGRFPFSQTPNKGMNLYGGLGIGVFRTEAGATGATTTKTTIGGTVLVGAWLSEQVSLEASYRIASSVNGNKPSTINFAVGFRF